MSKQIHLNKPPISSGLGPSKITDAADWPRSAAGDLKVEVIVIIGETTHRLSPERAREIGHALITMADQAEADSRRTKNRPAGRW